jgi:hypothetical protein
MLTHLIFFTFGYLKQQLLKRKTKTLDRIWKLSKEERSLIDQKMIPNVYTT